MKLLWTILTVTVLAETRMLKMYNDSSLVPQNVPLVVFNESFVYSKQQNILLSNKLVVRGQIYSVSDIITNQTMFKITSHFLSSRNIRTLYDNNENPICNLRNNYTLYIRQGLYLKANNDQLVAKFKQTFSMFKLRILTTVTNLTTGKPVKVLLLGDGGQSASCRIFLIDGSTETLIGKITLRESNKQLIGKRDQIIRVVAGVDVSFMIMLAASFDSSFDKFKITQWMQLRRQ